MSEWSVVVAVFWIFWALDGFRLLPWSVAFVFAGASRFGWGATVFSGRCLWPGPLPSSFRVTASDIPFCLSPAGISNRPVGGAQRPARQPSVERAWRWEEIQHAHRAGRQLFINHAAFCDDTGHLTPAEILALAKLPPALRARRIAAHVGNWLRPAHLRRRAIILRRRTRFAATINTVTLVIAALASAYLVANLAATIDSAWQQRIAALLPVTIAQAWALHALAAGSAWSSARKLQPRRASVTKDFLSAALVPATGLRLRALVGEGFFPSQHPVALALAFGSPPSRERIVFNALSDLKWPLPQSSASPLTIEIETTWRQTWLSALERGGAAYGIRIPDLFAPPTADSFGSNRYCPRCRSQFTSGRECPHRIPLLPLRHPHTPAPAPPPVVAEKT